MRAFAIVVVTAMALASCGKVRDTAGERPNIVIILVDDLGWADVGYHGGRIRTPRIDRLARESVEFNRFYVSPVCTPTRAGLLTGRYPIRYGLARSAIKPWRRFGLDPAEVTLAELLDSAGYEHRAAFGKWHLGHLLRKWHPLNQGFSHFYGHYNGAIDYYTHVRVGEHDWHVDYEPRVEQGYATDLVADAASHFIKEHADEGPFFCYVAFNAPHEPLQAPRKYVDMYGQLQGARRILAAMITCLDDGIGRILDSIDEAGIRDNTMVWFMSDNGGIEVVPDNNLPLRGNKADVFEGGVRVPASVRWPAGFSGGRKIDTPAAYIDVLPTVMNALGISDHGGKPVDGVTLLGVLKGEYDIPARDLYFYVGNRGPANEQVAIISSQWKLIVLGPNIERGTGEKNRVLLFDILHDPHEENDVSADHPDVVDELSKRLVAFRQLQPVDAVHPSAQGRNNFRAPADWRIPDE